MPDAEMKTISHIFLAHPMQAVAGAHQVELTGCVDGCRDHID